jgi:hypothetical protein
MDPTNFWNDIVRHPNRDSFAKARDIRPHLRNVKAAVLTVGGWFDSEDLFGSLNTYKTLEAMNPGTQNSLVMGPWVHGSWRDQGVPQPHYQGSDQVGPVQFGHRLGLDFQEKVELPFLRRHLKDQGDFAPPEAWVFKTGANGWQALPAWPPRDTRATPLYLHTNGFLSFNQGNSGGKDTFVSDPRHPVPYTQSITFDYHQSYMTEDQRFAATRPDVLVYQTDPLKEDLTIAGSIKADLWASTTGTDSDWVVKVIDVWPDEAKAPEGQSASVPLGGYQQLIRGDIMRGKYRHSLEKPEPFIPGKPTQVTYPLLDCFHTFKKGHRLMVQIQSSWFPLFDRNPQVFTNIYEATPEQFKKATQTIFHSKGMQSSLVLPVWAGSASNQ